MARVAAWHALAAGNAGSRCALYLNDSIEFGAALYGAWHAGKTVYLPGDNLPATCTGLAQAVDFFLGEFPDEFAAENAGFTQAVDTKVPAEYSPLSGAFLGLVVYTSGSTGAAQAIPKRLSQMAAEVNTLEAVFGARSGVAETLATVSHQHIYGLLFKVLWPLNAGRPLHARSRIFPEELAVLLNMRECVLVSSPAHLKRLPDSPIWSGTPPRARAVFSSGGPLALEDSRAAAQLLGQIPIEVYGSSETGGIAWRQQSTGSEVWRPMPAIDWRIDADDGLLEVRSAYLYDAGWLRMSDRASAAVGGFMLHGRVDRIVKIEEKRVSLDAIEGALRATPWVVEARALVLQGKRQRIGVVLVPTELGQSVLTAQGKLALNRLLRDALARAIEAVALPRRWRHIASMPVNTQGKTTQADLLALFQGVAALPSAPIPTVSARPCMPQARVLEHVREGDGARVVLECLVPVDLIYFEGHFPGTPVLPGIVLVEWAMALARQHLAVSGNFLAVRALKFHAVVTPGMRVTLELLHDRAKSTLAFRFDSEQGAHAGGKIQLTAVPSTAPSTSVTPVPSVSPE